MRAHRMAALALVATTVVSVVAVGRAAAQETPSDTLLTVGHFFDLEAVSGPQISPDGSQIVYTRRWVNKVEDRYESTLWIMRADGSHNRMLTKGSDPQWSPDGTRIAYLADGEPKGAQIYMRWAEGEQGPTQLTHLTESPADIKWSPDGKSIGFTSFVPKPVVWAIDMPKAPDSAHWTKAPRIVESLHFKEDRRGYQETGLPAPLRRQRRRRSRAPAHERRLERRRPLRWPRDRSGRLGLDARRQDDHRRRPE